MRAGGCWRKSSENASIDIIASACYHKNKDGVVMAGLSVRKLDRKVYEGLRMRAALHGISMEEEVRRILSQAVLSPNKISDVFIKYFGPDNGIDLDFPNQKVPHEPMDFEE